MLPEYSLFVADLYSLLTLKLFWKTQVELYIPQQTQSLKLVPFCEVMEHW
jgi:hypothetical protein